ncbi:PDZ domain-containing protein [Persicirhabdus sediminis]|uniref:PDZ domain-containing protein n=1 Tax=Persicirhabdus sediminis TaxID=454144 RepID=A0A8J7MAW1_9BACT|nr:PDZ domain-containing protein [Persicirhabdus sediminis]MBK1790067.1 PDZ domain-containing protein [Persicirhabdus sediminis]
MNILHKLLILATIATCPAIAAESKLAPIDLELLAFADTGDIALLDKITEIALADPQNSLPVINKHYLTARSNEEQLLLQHLLRTLFEATVELPGPSSFHGIKLTWYIDYSDGNLSTYPLVARVEQDSPAELAGFREGDCIVSINSKDCRGHNSKLVALETLNTVQPDSEVVIEIRRTGWVLTGQNLKNKPHTLTLKPIKLETQHDLTDYQDMMFGVWLSKIGH